MTVVEVDPKNGSARKDRKGKGTASIEENLDIIMPYTSQAELVSENDRPER